MLPLPRSIAPSEFDALIAAVRARSPTASEVAQLAEHLAASGHRLSFAEGVAVADVASTGGPGSLSTLLTPLALRVLGLKVAKMAVPGRPAGAIDTLATIPGYRPHREVNEAAQLVDTHGFAHFLADEEFAPMDAALFGYRKAAGAVDVPALATASLLSKKLAVGVKAVGLDVRVGPFGNLGQNVEEARANAAFFCATAQELGIASVAFLSTGPSPAQPAIGRGESLVALGSALEVDGAPPATGWLVEHLQLCLQMARHTAQLVDPAAGQAAVMKSDLRASLRAHLQSHGANWDGFVARIAETQGSPRLTLLAEGKGTLSMDLRAITSELVAMQAEPSEGFDDPSGLTILKSDGSAVAAGEPIAVVRAESDEKATDLARRLRKAFTVGPQTETPPPATPPMEVIRA